MITLTDAPAAKADRSSESEGGHYYEWLPNDRRWVPLYVEGGTFTMRQARPMQAAGRKVVPSTTTYFKDLFKKQLEDWKLEQVAKVCYADKLDRHSQWVDEAGYVETMVAKASSASRGAADLGTRIHNAVEAAIRGEDYDADLAVYVRPVMAERASLGLKTLGPEVCVGSLEHGYGGKVDDRCEGMIVLDVKSRKWKESQKKAPVFGTDKMQVASYGFAEWGDAFFEKGTGIVQVVSTTTPGRVQAVPFTGPELKQAFDAFVGLTAVWRFNHNFDPRT